MKVKFWGVRGSIPTPLASDAIRDKIITALQGAYDVDLSDPIAVRSYVDRLPPLVSGTAGGNTACVEIQAGGQTLIVDAGSGIRQLGESLMQGPCGRGQGVIHLFLSHTHWDHIQGFPFFVPAFIPGNRIYIYSVHQVDGTMSSQMQPATFPIQLEALPATIQFIQLAEGQELMLGDVRITTMALPHPGTSYAYRFEHRGASCVYASDAEYKYLDDAHVLPYVRFYSDADMLIFDAQYTLSESLLKADWGHSSALIGIDLALRARVKRLVLFHHDPTNSDPELANILSQTIAFQETAGTSSDCSVMLAMEGLMIDLEPVSTYNLTWQGSRTAVMRIIQDFDQEAAQELIREVEAVSPQLPQLVVDLSDVNRMSIACLRSLIDLRRYWEGHPMVLTSLAPAVMQVIELTRCLDFFSIYPTITAALEALTARETLNLPGYLLKGRYRIEAKLGESDLGVIFRATDTRLDRMVMIRVLSPQLTQQEVKRLLGDALLMARLHHPAIVTIYDCDEDQGLAFMVMEYAGSKTLRTVLEEGRATTPLSITSVILEALEYAHSRGVVHGNLKPENVLLDPEPKITDVGLRIDEGGQLISEAHLTRTPPYYMAPEQLLGMPVDGRADLYALGVMLYEMFTGARPFEGDPAQVIDLHLNAEPVPPRELNDEISRSLEYLILKLLAKQPDQRYSDAVQVRRVLSSLEATQPGDQALLAQRHLRSLVGRDAHVRRFLRLWALVERGEGQMVLLAGEPGIGKTRLCEEIAGLLRSGLVLMAGCNESDNSLPYQLISHLVSAYLETERGRAQQAAGGADIAALAAVVPEAAALLKPDQHRPLLEPDQERLRIKQGFLQLVRQAAADQPVLLICDDLHWADPASLEVLHYVASAVREQPLLLVATYRDIELDSTHPLHDLVRSMTRSSICHHFELTRLEEESVRLMLAEIWQQNIPSEWVHAIYNRTGGNPFYIEEVARSLVDEGTITRTEGGWHFPPLVEVKLPPNVREIVLRRLERLSAMAHQTLREAAILGQQFTFTELIAISEAAEKHLLESLDEALGLDLIRELEGGIIAFINPELQQVLYDNLSATRRRALHRRAALALEELYHQHRAANAAPLANHFVHAGEHEHAFRYSLQAALQAQAIYAFDTAIDWYEQALLEAQDAQISDTQLVEAQEGYANALQHQARYAEARDAFLKLIEIADQIGDAAAKARALNHLGWVMLRQGEYTISLSYHSEAEGLARSINNPTETVEAVLGKGWSILKLGHMEDAEKLAYEALDLTRMGPETRLYGRTLNLIATVANRLGRFPEARSYYNEALAIYRQLGDKRGEVTVLNNLGSMADRMGDYQQAVEFYSGALDLAGLINDRDHQIMFLTNIASVRVQLGDYRAAEIDLRRALDMAETWVITKRASFTNRVLAEALLGQSRLDEALQMGRRALDEALASNSLDDEAHAWAAIGSIAAKHHTTIEVRGQRLDAATCYAEATKLFGEVNLYADQARALRSWARFSWDQGQLEAAERLWSSARDLFAKLDLPLELERMERSPLSHVETAPPVE